MFLKQSLKKTYMKKFLLFFMFIIIVFSFSPEDYFYINETTNNTTITTYNFTLDGTNYTIYYINNEPTFLYKQGESGPITELSKIQDILYKHYSAQYYINEGDINYIKEQLDIFNKSRNNGDQFRNIEEYACRKALGENLPIPSNLDIYGGTIYDFYSVYLCQSDFGDAIGCSNKDDIEPYIVSFFESSYGIDHDLNNITYMLNHINYTNIYTYLKNIKSNMSEINSYVDTIKHNKFRYPVDIRDCPDCWGMCAELIVNETAYNNIIEKIDELENKTYKLGNFEKEANEIYNNTNERLEYLRTKNLREYYIQKLDIINSTWNEEKESVDESLNLLTNNSIKLMRDQIDNNIEVMYKMLNNKSFEQLDERYNQTDKLIKNVVQYALNNKELYLKVYTLSNKVDDLFLLSQDYGIDVSDLEKEKEELDNNFMKGIEASKAVDFYSEYSNLYDKLNARMNSNKHNLIFTNLLDNIVYMASSGYYVLIKDLPYKQRAHYLSLFPIIIPIVDTVSFSSLILLVSLMYYIINFNKFNKKKTSMFFTIVGIVIAFVSLLFIASYFLFSNNYTHGHLSYILSSINNANNVVILVESPTKSMLSCANLTKSKLNSKTKNTTLIILYNSYCSVDDMKYTHKEDCLNYVKTPYIYMRSSTNNTYSINTLGEVSITVKANDAYYDKCPIAYFMDEVNNNGQ